MDTTAKIYWNGDICDQTTIDISSLNEGLLRGVGVFETLPVYNSVPMFLDQHYARLIEGCDRLHITPPSLEKILAPITELAASEDTAIRITLFPSDSKDRKNNLLITTLPLPETPVPPNSLTIDPYRISSKSRISGIKSTSYAEYATARKEAVSKGYDDALLLNQNGHVVETSTSNIFAVWDNQLYTPSLETGCLPGITRQILIKEFLSNRIKVIETEFPLGALIDANEIFTTSSNKKVVPITKLEEHQYSADGPLTKKAIELYQEAIDDFLKE